MNKHFLIYPRQRQAGISLVIVLIFVVILTALGAFSLRRVLLAENLSRNAIDLEVARQAAEAALRDAERDILASSGMKPGAVCSRGADRPINVNENLGDGPWGATCPKGQCAMGDARGGYYQTSNFNANPSVNPEPWWPGKPTDGYAPPFWNNDFNTKPSPTNAGACANFIGGVPLGTYTGSPRVNGVWRQPEYLIEVIFTGFKPYFRITSRGWGLSPNSEVVLQTYFNVKAK
jgi:type IV pilus assembly protein PilX